MLQANTRNFIFLANLQMERLHREDQVEYFLTSGYKGFWRDWISGYAMEMGRVSGSADIRLNFCIQFYEDIHKNYSLRGIKKLPMGRLASGGTGHTEGIFDTQDT
uniref:Uncharacterized protein n=1 Tax=Romanomermis culicivorax TaxID=13658 RepID=A0A915L8G1_ROMCU